MALGVYNLEQETLGTYGRCCMRWVKGRQYRGHVPVVQYLYKYQLANIVVLSDAIPFILHSQEPALQGPHPPYLMSGVRAEMG